MKTWLKRYTEWFSSVFRFAKVLRRLLSDALPGNRLLIGATAVLAVAMAVLPIGSSYVYSRIISALSENEPRHEALSWFATSIGLTLFIVLLGVLRSFLEKIFFSRMTTRFTMLYMEKKSEIGIDKLEEPKMRDLISKAQERGIWPSINILDAQPEDLARLIGLLGAITVLGSFNAWYAVAVCVALVPQFLVDVYYGKTLWTIWDGETEERRWYGERQRHFWQRTNLIELRLFQNTKYFLDRLRGMLLTFQDRQVRAERKRHVLSVTSSLVASGAIACVLFLSLRSVMSGELDIQKLIFLWGSVTGVQGMFGGLLKSISNNTTMALYVTDSHGVIDAVKESDTKKGTLKVSARVPEIEFRDVWFRYPWTDGEWVLKGVSFSVRPGEKLALVGINGAGKTTLVKLLAGIYEPTKGDILVDGVSLRDMSIESWRSALSILFQEFTAYHGTIREIVSYGDTSVPFDEDRFQAALKASGCDSFILDLPRGADTIIGRDFEGGIELSGGQRQRLALARIWYRLAKVVVLDEPTASLDAFAEMKIFGEIESRRSGETIILITHRMFSVMKAEHIVVLDNGLVAEQGTHAELMLKDGVYREMFESQAKPYLEAMRSI